MLAALRAATTPWVLAPPVIRRCCRWTTLRGCWQRWSKGELSPAWLAVRDAGSGVCPDVGRLCDDLVAWLAAGEGGVGRWLQRHRPVRWNFLTAGWWRNINTPEELARLEAEWGVWEARYDPI